MATLADIISQIESGGNRKAMRFEAALHEKIAPLASGGVETGLALKIAIINKCSPHTGKMIYSTSWGMFQFMGMTLYDLGYDKPVLDFIESEDDQRAMFDGFVTRRGIAFTVDQLRADEGARLTFARHYNGAGNEQAYADRIRDEIARQDGAA